MVAEKRRNLRYPSDFKVVCRLKAGEAEGRAVNVSRGGLLISTRELLEAGSLLDISFAVSGVEQITLRAIVRHASEANATGIEFVEVLPRDQARLNACLESLDASCRAAAGFGAD
jgi:hypothetical protein